MTGSESDGKLTGAEEPERRSDGVSSKAIRRAIELVALYGYDRARQHLHEAGVQDTLARHMLLIRYDRRASK